MLHQPTYSLVTFEKDGIEYSAAGKPEEILKFLKKHKITKFVIRGSAHSEVNLVVGEFVQNWANNTEEEIDTWFLTKGKEK